MKLRAVFGLNVQRLRRERKLSQEQLSFVSGRTRAYISSVEAGRRNATLDTLEILAKALDVAPRISLPRERRRPVPDVQQSARGEA